ncbi:MAG TPA: MmgE/PrpD family protein [Sutterella sp.]|nr:MmgE/PrpD family protein [Sutterella sp.]
MQEGLLVPIAKFIVNTRFEDIPESVIKATKVALADWVCVTMPGADMPVAQDVKKFIEYRRREGKSVLFGSKETADPMSAALFNGTASHALDYDDCGHSVLGHPTVPVAPVAFALAQLLGLDGKDLMRTYLLGLEAECQIGRWTTPVLSQNGWHTTMAYGVLGAAAAAAAAYGLTEEQTVNALAIAASRAGGLRSNFGTKTKALHAGLAAMSGLEAALLAKSGITGNPKALEAQDGYFQCLAGPAPIKAEDCEVNIGKFWDIVEVGLLYKQYPCCSGSHPTNDVLDEFLRERPLKLDDIERIHAGVSLLSPRELTCHRPTDCIQAKFSLEYAITARLLYGPIVVDTFTDEKVRNPEVQAFFEKIEYEIDDELAKKYEFTEKAPIKLDIWLKNGEHIFLERDMAYGNPEKPFTEEQRKRKFDNCLESCGCASLIDPYWKTLCELEKADAAAVAAFGVKP